MESELDLDDPAIREHLERFTRTVLGVAASEDVQLPPMPPRLARLLLRAEERETGERDQWGCWEFGQSENFRNGTLWQPEVDAWVDGVRATLQGEQEPPWPDGRRFAVSLTHDVDMVTRTWTPGQVVRSLRIATTSEADATARGRAAVHAAGRAARYRTRRAPSAEATLERCVDVERTRGVRGSYFFTIYPPGRASAFDCVYAGSDRLTFRGKTRSVAAVVRELAAEGFDVGLHGSYFSAVDDSLLARQKEALEALAGVPVSTTRQHWLHWHVDRTPRLQAEAGFRADSTLGFNRNVGFRTGTSFPHFQFDARHGTTLDLLEIPLIVQEGALFADNALELGADAAREVVRTLVERVASVGGVFSFLVHPHSLLDPRVSTLYEWMVDHALDQGAWVASVADVDRWWRERFAKLEAPATGSTTSSG